MTEQEPTPVIIDRTTGMPKEGLPPIEKTEQSQEHTQLDTQEQIPIQEEEPALKEETFEEEEEAEVSETPPQTQEWTPPKSKEEFEKILEQVRKEERASIEREKLEAKRQADFDAKFIELPIVKRLREEYNECLKTLQMYPEDEETRKRALEIREQYNQLYQDKKRLYDYETQEQTKNLYSSLETINEIKILSKRLGINEIEFTKSPEEADPRVDALMSRLVNTRRMVYVKIGDTHYPIIMTNKDFPTVRSVLEHTAKELGLLKATLKSETQLLTNNKQSVDFHEATPMSGDGVSGSTVSSALLEKMIESSEEYAKHPEFQIKAWRYFRDKYVTGHLKKGLVRRATPAHMLEIERRLLKNKGV